MRPGRNAWIPAAFGPERCANRHLSFTVLRFNRSAGHSLKFQSFGDAAQMIWGMPGINSKRRSSIAVTEILCNLGDAGPTFDHPGRSGMAQDMGSYLLELGPRHGLAEGSLD